MNVILSYYLELWKQLTCRLLIRQRRMRSKSPEAGLYLDFEEEQVGQSG